MTTPSVAIIGGGFTGLTAAYRLARAGCNVTVYEAGAELGGLAAGFEVLGRPAEKAYHFLYRTDDHILGLLDELGLGDSVTFHPSSVSTYVDGQLYPMMTPLDLLRFKPLRLRDRIRAGVTVAYLQRIRNWRRLTRTTALEWLRRWAGQEVTGVIWEPLLRGKFDRYYDEVTMAWLWGRIKQRVDSRQGSAEVLGYVRGGFATIVETLTTRIVEMSGSIRTSTRVERLRHDSVTDTVTVRTSTDEERYDAVLATVPSRVVARLIDDYRSEDPNYFADLESVRYLAAVVLVFATEQQLSPYYWHNINTAGAPFVVLLSLTNLIGTEAFDGKHVYYVGDYVPHDHAAYTTGEEQLKAQWFAQLEAMFPDFDRSLILEDHLFRFRDAQHIVDVGFEERLAAHETPCPHVLMANFSQIFPMDRGTNYAVRDGAALAARIVDKLSDRGLHPARTARRDASTEGEAYDDPRRGPTAKPPLSRCSRSCDSTRHAERGAHAGGGAT